MLAYSSSRACARLAGKKKSERRAASRAVELQGLHSAHRTACLATRVQPPFVSGLSAGRVTMLPRL